MSRKFISFFTLFWFSALTSIIFASADSFNVNKSKNFSSSTKENTGMNGKNPPPQSKQPSSRGGTDRRTSSQFLIQNDEEDSESSVEKESYNPVTGWHTIRNEKIVNYRGLRKVITDESLKVSFVKTEKSKKNLVSVEICFNQEINPKSFSLSNLKIDGKSANNDVKFYFSKKGDSVKIQIPSEKDSFSLSLSNIETFDGEKIQDIQLGKISVK